MIPYNEDLEKWWDYEVFMNVEGLTDDQEREREVLRSALYYYMLWNGYDPARRHGSFVFENNEDAIDLTTYTGDELTINIKFVPDDKDTFGEAVETTVTFIFPR